MPPHGERKSPALSACSSTTQPSLRAQRKQESRKYRACIVYTRPTTRSTAQQVGWVGICLPQRIDAQPASVTLCTLGTAHPKLAPTSAAHKQGSVRCVDTCYLCLPLYLSLERSPWTCRVLLQQPPVAQPAMRATVSGGASCLTPSQLSQLTSMTLALGQHLVADSCPAMEALRKRHPLLLQHLHQPHCQLQQQVAAWRQQLLLQAWRRYPVAPTS